MTESRLFKPLKIGNMEVKHRIGMAPLTRLRAGESRVPNSLMKEYYSQRASEPGTLLISEGTVVSLEAGGGFPGAPGIWNDDQVSAWKEITDEVHSKGSFIFSQLFAFGRNGDAELAKKEGIEVVGPSAIPPPGSTTIPRALTTEEVQEKIQAFVTASKNAIAAGFDGVEIHGANGYLVDQFIQDVSNQRTDAYGGSIENRSRFAYDMMKAVADAVGPERVGLRLSPWSTYQGMGMRDPIPQFSDVIVKVRQLNLAYLHLIEARVVGTEDVVCDQSLEFAYKLWDAPLLVAGGYKLVEALKLVDERHADKDIMVVFGRDFIANPDLVYRFQKGLELNPYIRQTFYTSGPVGYVDYPFAA
ncbi:hypothetical protein F66182_3859 [Fusarium sp. NRRL 66182]|nr:hypothetical protein F66182_3859 [Fusarium sp. NRRL 66182]